MNPESGLAILWTVLIILLGVCFALAYKLGYRNGEAGKIAHVLETVFGESKEEDGNDDVKQRDAQE